MPNLPWYVYAMLLAPLALILFAAIYKSLQVRRRRAVDAGQGGDFESKVRRQGHGRPEDGFRVEPRNFANIVYEYSVSGQTLSNNRVSIGEDRGDFEVAETIARYPVGKPVTVYYNPRHPRDAVLERDTPRDEGPPRHRNAVLPSSSAGVFGLNQLTGSRQGLRNPKCRRRWCSFAAFRPILALFALACGRHVAGKDMAGGVGHHQDVGCRAIPRARKNQQGGPVMYQRQVSYAYRFNNVAYSSVQATFATGANSRSGWLARKFTTAYQNGASVDVHVNPANPSEAVLNRAPA